VAYLKRRSSTDSLCLILDKSEKVLSKILSPATENQGIAEGHDLINAVFRDTMIKRSIHAAGLIASILGLAALIVMLVSGGVLGLVLLIAASAVWLGLAGYNFAAPLFKKGERVKYGAVQPTHQQLGIGR
jgi:hypothetical protein